MIGELKLASIKSHHLYLEYTKVTSSSRVQILLKTLIGFIYRIYLYPQVSYFKHSIINVSYLAAKIQEGRFERSYRVKGRECLPGQYVNFQNVKLSY